MPGVAPQPPGQSTSPPTAVSERPPAPRPLSVPPPAGLRSDEWRLGRATRETPAPAHEIARTQEIVRTRVFFLLATALAVIVLLLVPVLGGDPEAKRALVASLAPAALGSAWFAWALGNESHYSVDRTLFVGLLCLAAALGWIHYFGAFSLAVAVLPVGLFFFGTIGDGRAAAIAFVASASSYFVLVAAMLRGALVDRGLVATDLTPPQKVILAALVEIVLLLSFLNARTARATTQLALARQDRLVRGLAQRDALLQEARQDLARALDVAGVGRFSDTTVGTFHLGNVIGRGAMGEVYEAFHAQTRKEAAVKLLHAHSLRERAVVKRFVREAKMAASLDTPNVVRVLEVGGLEHDGELPYIAMERLRGEDLSERLRRQGRLEIGEVVAMLVQVGRGLMAARAAGIVHRDLKPRNIFLAESTAPTSQVSPGPSVVTQATAGARVWKILDFGVSKLAGQESTQTLDRIVGTPEYMAPEQAAGAEVSHRTDLFSLAVITYRALTGRPAFSGDHIIEILYRVASTNPPRASEVASLPPEVDLVLAVAMAKAPSDRFDGAQEFADALEAAARGVIDPALAARAEKVLAKLPWDSGQTAVPSGTMPKAADGTHA
jgi:serine/threonine protein kinase